ncbi:FMN-binding protein, partial [Holdemania filiformis]|uniref:FMN-binding protein n=1 Tax=Holdemania filiformis TaxID=61171 RepID=UPI003A92A5B7
MKKWTRLLAAAALLISAAACSAPEAKTETLEGKGNGFGGLITVTVTRKDGKITDVKAIGDQETQGIGSQAIEQLPQAIVKANSTDVDNVSGATFSSQGIKDAVNNALDPQAYPYVEKAEKEEKPKEVAASDLYQGLAVVSNGRLGPGKDDKEVSVYSFNEVVLNALFDKEGKILDLNIDELEVATPNYDGADMPQFSGFPGQGGYNNDENHDGKVEGKTADSEEQFLAEFNTWKTKRERGDSYKLNSGTWASEMDVFEQLFVGKTVAEVEDWFAKYTDANGRPLQAEAKSDEDKAKFSALTDDEKKMLEDVRTGATISLKDPHGDFITALKKAYELRQPLDVKEAAAEGLGLASNGRVGPGKDDQEVQVYSFNTLVVSALFDAEGRIVSLKLDEMEVATPNYDGADMPQFSGFPGQGGYNNDENHDGKVEGKTADTEDQYLAEFDTWKTKRERGDSYKLNSGTWAS